MEDVRRKSVETAGGMKQTIRVLLADDHAMVRDGLTSVLRDAGDLEVVATAANGFEAVQQALQTQPDVVVIDIVMPGLNGIEATVQIHDALPAVHIVVMSMYSDIDFVYRALRAGAHGYVAKASAAADLIEAVRGVVAGRRFLSRGVAQSVLDDYIQTRASKSPLERLAPRERQVLQLLAEGHSSAGIASILSLAPKTVETYRSRMMGKLGIAELPALIKFAIQHGMTPPE
jgi:DNA-binding NarL/FixJ family response regulator